jgi:nucleotide-binding universal stress UspA family protein
MFERILLSVDGSDHARRATEVTAGLAARMDADVTVVNVREVPASWVLDLDPTLTWADSELVDEIVRELKDQGISARGEILASSGGTVAHDIVEAAKAADASLIVMGTRGLTDPEGVLFGSVAHKVIHRAPCPVMVVR